MMLTTVLAFVVTLGILIVIHEYGHYRVAVACGVKVLRFSVGFGRVIWRRQSGPDATEFVISALPLGGYVRMLDEREGPVPPSDLHRAFNRKPLWQRSAVVAAGPLANLFLAVVLYAAAHWIGMDEPKARLGSPSASSLAYAAGVRAGDWVQAVSADAVDWTDVRSMSDLRWQLTQAVLKGAPLHLLLTDGEGAHRRQVTLALDRLPSTEMDAETLRLIGLGTPFGEPVVGAVTPGGPADVAGLREGDRVLSVDGAPVDDAASLRERIRNSASAGPSVLRWQVQRAGQVVSLAVRPAVVDDGARKVGRIEAMLGQQPEMVTVRYGAWEGLATAFEKTWDMSALTLKLLGRMVIGEASLKNLSGPLTIADYAGQSVRLGFTYYLGFLAVVSVSLGILNLLPLPMLDGGHLMYHLFEAVTGHAPSDVWLERLQRGGVAIMLLMMSLALYNDVARYLGLP